MNECSFRTLHQRKAAADIRRPAMGKNAVRISVLEGTRIGGMTESSKTAGTANKALFIGESPFDALSQLLLIP